MNILTIDASLSSTGYAIFKNKKLAKFGKICPSKNEKQKLKFFYEELLKIIKENKINDIVIEDGFSKIANLRTGLMLAELRGCIKLLAYMNDVEIYTVAPQQIKKIITGKGNATKEDVANKLCEIYADNSLFKSIGTFSDKNNREKTSDIYDAISLFEYIRKGDIEK